MFRYLYLVVLLIMTSCTSQNNININEYPMVTTIYEIANNYNIKIDKSGKYETAKVTSYFDGAKELEYEYELIETGVFDPLYYSITIETEPTIEDAKLSFSIGKGVADLVGNSFEQGIVRIDSVAIPGDDSFYALQTYEGEPIGMVLKIRRRKAIFTMIISGMYTLDHSLIKDLIIPKLSNLDKFKVKK